MFHEQVFKTYQSQKIGRFFQKFLALIRILINISNLVEDFKAKRIFVTENMCSNISRVIKKESRVYIYI